MKKDGERLPRNLSAWIDLTIHLAIMLVLIFVMTSYNAYMAAIAFVVWVCLASFAQERCRDRTKRFERYCRSVISNISVMMNYAIERLPQAIIIVNEEGRVEWTNSRVESVMGARPEQDADAKEFWPGIIIEPVWGTEGDYVFADGEKFFKVRHVPVKISSRQPDLMALYIQDVSSVEDLKKEYLMSRTVIVYIQIDNYDEVMQGLNETDRTSLLLEVNQHLDEWMKNLKGFMRRVADDLYVVILTREALERAIKEKFYILDKVRAMQSTNRLPVTLSMGVSVAENQTMAELGSEAQSVLDLALGRGGDQVAVHMSGKTQFFGGRAQAVEKHTRVKARVVAHAIREMMEGADDIFIMGHHNEDFDCFGAAMGVAKMARHLEKNVHIILSDMNDGIDKFIGLLKDKEEYAGLLVKADDTVLGSALNPLLFVVDTHVPRLVASPAILNRVRQVIVIDHHRRADTFIKSPLLVYIEPSSSSTSELVTELITYFSDNLVLSRLDATALYSGIVVDTKNFAVQTGVRTFDAAAYLRRSGADPVMVRHLFRSDYETTVALAKAQARSEYYEGGLIVSTCPDKLPNAQIIASQAADSFLRIENVRMSIVCFHLSSDVVGISARSTGELNVQVIMEEFGGGGHQNVAGAQVKNGDIDEIKAKAVAIARKYIEEADKHESNTK